MTVIHPAPLVCEALSTRLDGIPDTRVVAARYESLGPHDRLGWDLVVRRQKAITEDNGKLVVPRA